MNVSSSIWNFVIKFIMKEMCFNSGLYGEYNRLNMIVDICENGVIIRGYL